MTKIKFNNTFSKKDSKRQLYVYSESAANIMKKCYVGLFDPQNSTFFLKEFERENG